VTDLKAQTTSSRPHRLPVPPTPDVPDVPDDDDDDDDEEMEDDTPEEGNTTPVTAAIEPSASVVSLPSLSQITTIATTSPSVFSLDAGRRHYSISSASQASYSPYFHSNQASPAFGPQLPQILSMPPHGPNFGLGSPALKPVDSAHTLRQMLESTSELSDRPHRSGGGKRSRSEHEHELDQEAAAALSMLNNDRRSWRGANGHSDSSRSGTGMSVRDLLSG